MVLRVFGGWETMGKKSKLMARTSLRDNQCHGSTMTNTVKGNLSDVVWDTSYRRTTGMAPLALTNPAAYSTAD